MHATGDPPRQLQGAVPAADPPASPQAEAAPEGGGARSAQGEQEKQAEAHTESGCCANRACGRGSASSSEAARAPALRARAPPPGSAPGQLRSWDPGSRGGAGWRGVQSSGGWMGIIWSWLVPRQSGQFSALIPAAPVSEPKARTVLRNWRTQIPGHKVARKASGSSRTDSRVMRHSERGFQPLQTTETRRHSPPQLPQISRDLHPHFRGLSGGSNAHLLQLHRWVSERTPTLQRRSSD